MKTVFFDQIQQILCQNKKEHSCNELQVLFHKSADSLPASFRFILSKNFYYNCNDNTLVNFLGDAYFVATFSPELFVCNLIRSEDFWPMGSGHAQTTDAFFAEFRPCLVENKPQI